ncbi:hypothetical protein ACLB2K_029754 [Fragaria x ananassa]
MVIVEGLLGKLARRCYAVLCLGVLVVSVTVAHFIKGTMDLPEEPTQPRERSRRRLRALQGDIKQNKGSVTPMSSRPGTPSNHASPIHLLWHYRREVDSFHTSPRRLNFDVEQRYETDSPSPSHHLHIDEVDGYSDHDHDDYNHDGDAIVEET